MRTHIVEHYTDLDFRRPLVLAGGMLCYSYALTVSLKLLVACVLVACTLKVAVHVLACKLLWLILCVVCNSLCKFVLAQLVILVCLVYVSSLTGSFVCTI